MRNVPYSERIRQFVETNVQIYNIERGSASGILDYKVLTDPFTGRHLPEEL